MARTRFVPRRRPQNMNFYQRRTAAAKEMQIVGERPLKTVK